jgi:hypothetical protein
MKCKKHISFFLAIFLLFSNIGLAIDVHYCGEKVASIKPIYWKNYESLLATEKSCCASKGSSIVQRNESCCKDKVIHFEKKQENSSIKSIAFQSDFIFLLQEWNPIVFATILNFENSRIASYYCYANAPPLFKLYHQYIFYA